MPSKYDEQTCAKAVRLVTEHVQDYESPPAEWSPRRPGIGDRPTRRVPQLWAG